MGSSIDFPKLKKAISGLAKLESLVLPSSMTLTHTDDSMGQWPQLLTVMKIGGHIDSKTMLTFCWPQNLESLILHRCTNLKPSTLGAILTNRQLFQGLRELTIDANNEGLMDSPEPEPEPELPALFVLWEMEKLLYVKLPAHLATFLLTCANRLSPPSPLRALELTSPRNGDYAGWEIWPELFLETLAEKINNVWSLVVCPDAMAMLGTSQQEIDDEIWLHIPDEDDDHFHDPALVEFESIYPLGLSVRYGNN